jgi:hypothetical protein
MNGGKTKFISAREKRMRAQMKRDRDREQAVLIAAQQHTLFADPRGSGLTAAAGSMGNMDLLRSMGGGGGLDPMQLQALLASRAMGMPGQQEPPGGGRMAEQMMAAKQAWAMQQRDELQLQLLRQGGSMAGLSSIGDGNGMAASNHFLAAARNNLGLGNMNALSSQFPGSSLAGIHVSQLQQQQQLRSGAGDNVSISSLHSNNMTTEQFLLARQLAHGGGNGHTRSNMNQRFMGQNSGFTNNSTKPSDGGPGMVDPQLLQLYLEQQRNVNARQA